MTMIEHVLVENPTRLPTHGPTNSLSKRLLPLGRGALFAAAFGIAFGIGTTDGHILGLALAVPLTFAASIAVAIPSLFVVLAMLEAPIELGELLSAATSAYQHSGIVLGGLAPTLLLLSTSITDRYLVYFLGCGGLSLAALLGAYRLTSEAHSTLRKQTGSTKLRHWAVLLTFVGLSFEIAARFWTTALSLFGGLS